MRKDWASLWFIIQAEKGHSDKVPFYFFNPISGQCTDFSFNHRERDGVGALRLAYKKLHISDQVLPKPIDRPTPLKKLKLMISGLISGAQTNLPEWKFFDIEQKEKPDHLSCLVLDEEANQKLKEHLKKINVSLNSFLIFNVTQTVAKFLLKDRNQFSGRWLLPVNMRGGIKGEEDLGNCVSFIPITVESKSLIENIQRQIKEQLKSQVHWANWYSHHIGKVVGFSGMKKISQKVSQKSFWFGSLSDLGDWTPKDPSATTYKDFVWAVAAPGTPNNPIGCASIEWFGKRSISLRVHPSLFTKSSTNIDVEMLQSFKSMLCEQLQLNPEAIALHKVSKS